MREETSTGFAERIRIAPSPVIAKSVSDAFS